MQKRAFQISSASLLAALAATGVTLASCGGGDGGGGGGGQATTLEQARGGRGQQIFRHDTFGDEIFWSDVLRMHEVIEQAVSPNIALAVGLKVDAEALPQTVKDGIANGSINLDSRRRRSRSSSSTPLWVSKDR